MSIDALQNAAHKGDGAACLQLAMAWMTGEGVPAQDTGKGRHWLELAAKNGKLEAKRFLGLIYLRGMDVVPDYQKALEYLADAAGKQDHEAAWYLASFLGGTRNDCYDAERAISWLKAAAEGGIPRAQCHFAYCLQRGVLIEQDDVAAVELFARAAGNGDPGAMLALAEYFETGFMLPKDLNRAGGLARLAAQGGWKVADEYAVSLGNGPGDPRPDINGLLPQAGEISRSHQGQVPKLETEALSWKPRVFLMRNFLNAFECAEVANAAYQHLMPSFVVSVDGELAENQVRTSHEVRLRHGLRNIVLHTIEQRMAVWSHHPLENAELPLVLHYENSQSFEQHYDYFIPEKFVMGEGPLEWGGQRVATQLIYLNEAFEGGETRFDLADLVVEPERGMCMLFYNLSPDGNVDPLTRHTGVGVSSGEKWLLSRWIREIPFDSPAKEIKRDRYRQ